MVLIGDNNTGKLQFCALDPVLGPRSLTVSPQLTSMTSTEAFYTPPPDVPPENPVADGLAPADPDHEVPESAAPKIVIEVTIADLSEEQKGKFGDYVEFWTQPPTNSMTCQILLVLMLLRSQKHSALLSHGWYDKEEDDFEGATYFTRSLTESEKPDLFSKKHKQLCGFLYLRSIRTDCEPLAWNDLRGLKT